ncbi:MAG: iron ABC transporter permease [candidate division WOR-3 bacterium]
MNKVILLILILLLSITLELFIGPGKLTEEIIQLRINRIIIGIFAGSLLAFCGGVLQGLFGNPLVEPYTLGSASGAALGASLGIVLFGYANPVFAFVGALVIGVFVFAIARIEGGLLRERLILAGVVMSFLCSSLVMVIMIAGKKELYEVLYLLMGYLGIVVTPQNRIMIMLIFIISIFLIFYIFRFYREFDIISTGIETATSLGIDIQRFSVEIFVITTLLVSFAVSIVGAIGFVGLVIPHISRMLFGPKHLKNLTGSLFLGPAFVLFADVLARTLAVYELPTGIITSIVGVPFFIYLYRRR